MNARWIAIIAALGLLSLPALAGAAPQLTATGVRIGDHAAFVRVVVDFNGKVRERDVEAGRFAPRMAAVRVTKPGVTTQTSGRRAHGVRVALQPGTQMLHITTSFARHRFKYLSYAVVTGNRLAIDLWKSAPPPKASATGVGGCLSVNEVATFSGSGLVDVSGMEHGVFEHTFRVVVRGASGRVLGQRTVVHTGSWNTKVKYHAARRQAGTVEAVAFSEKDGSLACLAQSRVTLFAS